MAKQTAASVVIKQHALENGSTAEPLHWQDLALHEVHDQPTASAAQEDFEQRVAAEVARRVEKPLQAIRAAVEGIEQAQLACRSEWEQRLIRLAAAMAQRIIRRQLRQFPEITLDLLRDALQMAAGSPQLRIELNPDDYATLGQQAAALVRDGSPAAAVEVVPSVAVSPGGCRVETRFGSIDQRIETQLARLEEELS